MSQASLEETINLELMTWAPPSSIINLDDNSQASKVSAPLAALDHPERSVARQERGHLAQDPRKSPSVSRSMTPP